MTTLRTLPITHLQESKTNPRQVFDKKGMDELVASIREKGIITPLLVRSIEKGFEIIAGARRFRAAKIAKLTEVPAITREMTDSEALELQVIENDQRLDVHPLEQCAGYQRLMREGKFGVDELAKRVGKTVDYLTRRLKLADLIEPISKLYLENKIAWGHALQAARMTPEQQKQSLPWLKRGDSVRAYGELIQRTFMLVLKDAAFDTADAKLYPKAGPCTTCPKRTGFNKALFDDIQRDDVCTDPACFHEKEKNFVKIQVGTNKDAVLLTVGERYGLEPKGLQGWTKAGDKSCADTKFGIVVEKVYDSYPEKLGQKIKVCTNPKCKTHGNTVDRYGVSSTPSKEEQKRRDAVNKQERIRRIELRRRGLLFKLLAKDSLPLADSDFMPILDWAIENLDHDAARAMVQAMGWEPARRYDSPDYRLTVERQLDKLNGLAEIKKWLLLVTIAGTELYQRAGYTNKCSLWKR